MKNAIIIHGWPGTDYPDDASPSKDHWLPWLREQLEAKGIAAHTPDMPNPRTPDYKKWKSAFEQLTVNEETALIGHSCGGGFLVRWLSENPIAVAKVVLVAPWIDPDMELGEGNTFFDFKIDQNLAQRVAHGVTIFSSTNDESSVAASVATLASAIGGCKVIEIENAGHFCTNDGYGEFPALLQEIAEV